MRMRTQGGGSELQREREVYRYLPPYAAPSFCTPPEDNGGSPSQQVQTSKAYSSADRALNAFAQLGALRLKARRAMISLIDRQYQFILAEATQTLSSQSDDVHDLGDSLWMGVRTVPRKDTLCGEVMADLCSKTEPNPAFPSIIYDLAQENSTKDKDYVVSGPKIRFYVGVPIVTRDGHCIGSYCVMDDHPRLQVHSTEVDFLQDMSETVMEHLEYVAIRGNHKRAEKMVKGLGLFLEGHASISDWWLRTRSLSIPSRERTSLASRTHEPGDTDEDATASTDDPIVPSASADGASAEATGGSGFHEQLESSHIRPVFTSDSCQSVDPFRQDPSHTIYPHDEDSDGTLDQGGFLDHEASSKVSQDKAFSPAAVVFDPSTISGRTDSSTKVNTEDKKVLPEVASTIRSMLSRASNLIRESTEVEGVIFFDAKHGGFGTRGHRSATIGSRSAARDGANSTTSSSEDEWKTSSPSNTAESAPDRGYGAKSTDEPRACDVLAYSSDKASSLHEDALPSHLTVSEAFVRKLFKRHPHGKVFAFDEDGGISSSEDELQQHVTGGISVVQSNDNQVRKSTRVSEGRTVLKIFPGARFVLLLPLWDSHRERWFASTMLWTTNPARVLSMQDDLSYVAAFGNSIMAELERLDSVAADSTKSTLISSISHELRSPLHGVLGSIELLQDTAITDYQRNVIGTIRHCSATLLDTLNNVLDYAKINNFTAARRKEKKSVRMYSRSQKALPSERLRIYGTISLTSDLDLASVTEDVLGGLYAGYDYLHQTKTNAYDVEFDHRPSVREHSAQRQPLPLVVMLDIDRKDSWRFCTQPGAWKRILMNIYGNALKYTASGSVKVHLGYKDISASKLRSNQGLITLSVTDTGRGISEDFIKNHLYTPFAQENTLSQGAGLGLSIVRQIVTALDGKLEIYSNQGSGTTVKVMLKLEKSQPQSRSMAQKNDEIQRAQGLVKGRNLAIVGFDSSNTSSEKLSRDETLTRSLTLVRSFVSKIAQDWLNMGIIDASTFDLESNNVFLTTSDIFETRRVEWLSKDTLSTISKRHVIVVVDSAPSEERTEVGRSQRIHFISNPIGPRKLARCLISILGGLDPSDTHDMPSTPSSENIGSSGSILISSPEVQSPSPGNLREFSRTDKDAVPTISSDRPTILLVEDNPINMKILVACVTKLSVAYSVAENGAEAVKTYQDASKKPDIIFMDISMPVMNGLDAAKHIRSYESEKKLSAAIIIAVTGLASEESQREAYNSGINLFLSKPVPLRELKNIVQNWTPNSGAEGN